MERAVDALLRAPQERGDDENEPYDDGHHRIADDVDDRATGNHAVYESPRRDPALVISRTRRVFSPTWSE